MKIRFFSLFDYALFVCVLLLTIIGIFFIYSSGVNSQKVLVSNEYIKQISQNPPSDWSIEARVWAESNGLIKGD